MSDKNKIWEENKKKTKTEIFSKFENKLEPRRKVRITGKGEVTLLEI